MAIASIILWAHILAAVTWIGGSMFLVIAGQALRSMRRDGPNSQLRAAVIRFRDVSWGAVVVLVVTGLLNIYISYPSFELLSLLQRDLVLLAKVSLVAIMMAFKGLHDFFIGPRAARNPSPRSPYLRAAVLLGRLNLLLGMLVLYLAVLLRGRFL